jgi:hypothetical protein
VLILSGSPTRHPSPKKSRSKNDEYRLFSSRSNVADRHLNALDEVHGGRLLSLGKIRVPFADVIGRLAVVIDPSKSCLANP